MEQIPLFKNDTQKRSLCPCISFTLLRRKSRSTTQLRISEIKFPNKWKWFPTLAIYVQPARQLAVLLLKVQQKFYVLFMYKTEIQIRLKTSNN